jgi:hypothetical protein
MTTLSTVPATTPTVNQPEIVPINSKYEIHLYTMTGEPCAKLVQHTPKGRRKTKTIDNIRFASDSRRQEWAIWKAAAILKDERERAQMAAERKQANAGAQAEVGMIFVHSWGYDQTNIDYYEVIKVSGRMVTLREVQQDRTHTDQLQGYCSPKPGQYRANSKEFKKVVKVSPSDGDLYVSMEYGWCEQWDGQPDGWTAYA